MTTEQHLQNYIGQLVIQQAMLKAENDELRARLSEQPGENNELRTKNGDSVSGTNQLR